MFLGIIFDKGTNEWWIAVFVFATTTGFGDGIESNEYLYNVNP